ncbi:MAG: hypothetical protein Q9219_007519 [cf. Caloplaca sp. 3 TL-2023]
MSKGILTHIFTHSKHPRQSARPHFPPEAEADRYGPSQSISEALLGSSTQSKKRRLEGPSTDSQPTWAQDDEFQGLEFQASEFHKIDEVPRELNNDAITVTNNLFTTIATAEANDPILQAISPNHEFELPDPNDEIEEQASSGEEAPGQEPPQVSESESEFGEEPQPGHPHDHPSPGKQDHSPPAWGLPPSRRSSNHTIDTSEDIPHGRSAEELPEFTLAFAMWVEVSGLSRKNYESLLEVLDLLRDIRTIHDLPRSITTLKSRVRAQIPLIGMRKKSLSVVQEQLPTMTPAEKEQVQNEPYKPTPTTMFFLDPIDLFRVVLTSAQFRSKMHFGMAHFVDQPCELYHSNAWATSILSCSGQYATLSDGSPVFPSDVVYTLCAATNCPCRTTSGMGHLGRIHSVGKDFTLGNNTPSALGFTSPGEIILRVQKLIKASKRHIRLPKLHSNSPSQEYLLSEKDIFTVSQSLLIRRFTDIHFDNRYEGASRTTIPPLYTTKIVVRNVVKPNDEYYPLQLLPPTRGELELAVYGRQFFERLAQNKTLSVPVLTFIDAFGLYRNMYRSLMGVYCTIANLNWRERKRRANVLPLTLGPHGSNFGDVIRTLQPALEQLAEGVPMLLNDNEEPTTVIVYTMAFTGDLPQQQANSGFMSPIAHRGCSKCLVTKEQRHDLTFDLLLQSRNHYRVLYERTKAENLPVSRRHQFFQSMGMRKDQSPLVDLTPALDILRSRPFDAAHSEYAGIAKQAQQVLFEAILTPTAQDEYCSELRRFPFPPSWARLQSPKYHLKSYRMQECGLFPITSLLLNQLCVAILIWARSIV